MTTCKHFGLMVIVEVIMTAIYCASHCHCRDKYNGYSACNGLYIYLRQNECRIMVIHLILYFLKQK